MSRKLSMFWNGNIAASLLLICGLALCLIVTSKYINSIAEQEGFETLAQEAVQLGKEIRAHVLVDREQLEMMAFIIAKHKDLRGPHASGILANYKAGILISHLEILFPDDRVVLPDGGVMPAGRELSFAKACQKGAHISGRETGLVDPDKMVLRHYVPIVREGKTVAMLIGVVELEKLSRIYDAYALGGAAQFYVVEGRNGNLLVDTWHDTLRNTDMLDTRRFKEGYRLETVRADLAAGRSGNFAFVSQTIGKYFYSHYAPVGVNDWMVMLTIPEDVVFKNAVRTRMALFLLGVSNIVLSGAYFVWMLLKAKNEYLEKEKQLKQVRYMYDVEKLLFDAHVKEERMGNVLGIIADMMTAEKTFFLVLEGDSVAHAYTWDKGGYAEEGLLRGIFVKERFPYLCAPLYEKRSLILPVINLHSASFRNEYTLLKKWGFHNLVATPVLDMEATLIGILGAGNCDPPRQTAEQLENVSLSFSMALNNRKSYLTIKEMGMMDYLTGVLNRNSYHNAVAAYEKDGRCPQACIYIDADGLHELNNTRGHEAGDTMLRHVADALKNAFGEHAVYRIGGDEFVAFSEEKERVAQKTAAVERAVQEKDYHLSIGTARGSEHSAIRDMVRQAECRMYAAKRRYYQQKGDRRKVRSAGPS